MFFATEGKPWAANKVDSLNRGTPFNPFKESRKTVNKLHRWLLNKGHLRYTDENLNTARKILSGFKELLEDYWIIFLFLFAIFQAVAIGIVYDPGAPVFVAFAPPLIAALSFLGWFAAKMLPNLWKVPVGKLWWPLKRFEDECQVYLEKTSDPLIKDDEDVRNFASKIRSAWTSTLGEAISFDKAYRRRSKRASKMVLDMLNKEVSTFAGEIGERRQDVTNAQLVLDKLIRAALEKEELLALREEREVSMAKEAADFAFVELTEAAVNLGEKVSSVEEANRVLKESVETSEKILKIS